MTEVRPLGGAPVVRNTPPFVDQQQHPQTAEQQTSPVRGGAGFDNRKKHTFRKFFTR